MIGIIFRPDGSIRSGMSLGTYLGLLLDVFQALSLSRLAAKYEALHHKSWLKLLRITAQTAQTLYPPPMLYMKYA